MDMPRDYKNTDDGDNSVTCKGTAVVCTVIAVGMLNRRVRRAHHSTTVILYYCYRNHQCTPRLKWYQQRESAREIYI